MLIISPQDILETPQYIRQKFDECQTIALSNTLIEEDEKPLEYILRHIFRKYSEYFFTPLHVVEELPLEFVLTHYYEYLYESFSKEEKPEIQELLEKERVRLSETKEERMARLLKEKEESVDEEDLLAEIAEENKKAAILQAKRVKQQAEALAKELEKDSLSFKDSKALSMYNGPIDFKARSKIDSPDVRLPLEQSIKQSVPAVVYEELRELNNIEGYDE